MDKKIFEKLGLTQGEIKVYLALTQLGESTITPIVNKSKVTKSKIYDILQKLIDKGLVGYIIKSGTKHFTPNDPHMILEYLNKKEDELKTTKKQVTKILPELMMQRGIASQKRMAEIYEGFQGIKAIRNELMQTLKPKDTLLVLGAPKIANVKWEGWFLDFHKKRVKRNISMKIIYNADAKKYGQIREKMKLTQVKYLPNDLVSPNWIDIFPEAVIFVMLLETPTAFVVRDKELAKSFKAYFNIMWKQATIFQGKKGINEIYDILLNSKGKEYNTYGGGARVTHEVMGETWWKNLHTKRIEKKIKARQIFDETIRKFGTELRKRPLSNVKFLSQEFEQMQETVIIKDYVAIIIFTENPYGLLIKDKVVADGYRKQFELMWKHAKK